MATHFPANSVLQHDWYVTAQGETMLQCLYNPQTSGRKLFGILEKPAVPLNVEEIGYKLFFAGKSGVGKSASITRLAGIINRPTYIHTHGIQKTNVYWPAKIKDKIIMFKIQCWEAGENGLKKYSHIFPACKDKVDGLVFVFSYADASTFNDVQQNVPKFIKKDSENPAILVIGTRYSSVMQRNEVNVNDIEEFEYKWHTSVQKIPENVHVETNEVYKMAPLLNFICEQLWIRDQELILNRSFNKASLHE